LSSRYIELNTKVRPSRWAFIPMAAHDLILGLKGQQLVLKLGVSLLESRNDLLLILDVDDVEPFGISCRLCVHNHVQSLCFIFPVRQVCKILATRHCVGQPIDLRQLRVDAPF
jgi:hypothetical protein